MSGLLLVLAGLVVGFGAGVYASAWSQAGTGERDQ